MVNLIASRVSVLEERPFAEPVPQPPRTILVVDDDEGACRFIERVLMNAGYSTVVARNGSEGLRTAAATPTLDMVVTDVMMPDMSGCELVRQLRRDTPEMKVLYITGYRDCLFDEKVMMWEDEAFIDKPCSVKALLEAVSLLWSQRLDGLPPMFSASDPPAEDRKPSRSPQPPIPVRMPSAAVGWPHPKRRRLD